ncbi:hypothetical protein JSR02_00770 [Candidatus Vidania fulgoroideae]|uniref:Small ribosomal subunit protein uS5 n=1 Tax=Candidatus Vidania fulgoroideorum TaxID=881286 RepID=A0A974X8Y1_9PROT|nr:hypothetical protein JSR02_00770 [Candidatus Vidania fulgoroideae]
MKEILFHRRTSFVRKGGRNFKYCVFSVIHKNTQLCLGQGKSKNFTEAINKSFKYKKHNLIKPQVKHQTIPKKLESKICKTKLKFKPCLQSHGLIANNIIRNILKNTQIKNIYSEIIGSKNTINVIKATFKILKQIHAK